MSRGRPPITRARVLNYLDQHPGCTIMQIVRGTGADRRHIYRILHAAFGPDFRSEWPHSAKMGGLVVGYRLLPERA